MAGTYGKLNKKQKTLLDKYDVFYIDRVDGLYEALRDIKDFETLIQDADRYLGDKKMKTHKFMSW